MVNTIWIWSNKNWRLIAAVFPVWTQRKKKPWVEETEIMKSVTRASQASLKPLDNIVPGCFRGFREALNWSPWCREASLERMITAIFPVWALKKKKKKSPQLAEDSSGRGSGMEILQRSEFLDFPQLSLISNHVYPIQDTPWKPENITDNMLLVVLREGVN